MLTEEPFTLEQIKIAHAQAKTGADFPNYIQALIQLGVIRYETSVKDGDIYYFGEENYQVQTGAQYSLLPVAVKSETIPFQQNLKKHQSGQTDFSTFRIDAAQAGVNRWVVDTQKRTCTYYDKASRVLLVETIPYLF